VYSTDIINILSNKKVLYAEDEDGIRAKVSEILKLFFDTVVAVEDGKKALEYIETGSFDVLIFDICMPNIDGLEAIKKVRVSDSTIPIIIFSAHTEQQYLWRAVELKITKFITKPYNKDEFIEALEKVSLELVNNNLSMPLADGCIYNPSTKTAKYNNSKVQLSKQESRLLEYLYKRANQTVTFEDIFRYLWEFEQPSKEAIKSIIKELRRKLGNESINSRYGIGYILEV